MSTTTLRMCYLLFIFLFSYLNSGAQDTKSTPLFFHSNGSTGGVLKSSASGAAEKAINAYDPIKIQGRFFNKSSYPAAVIARFADENNEQNIAYPVAFVEKGETKDFTIYGPLFYDGRNKMSVQLQLFVVKDANDFKTLKDTYSGFYTDAIEFIPVLGQAAQFIDLGWKVAEKFAPKDKLETFEEIVIRRDAAWPLKTKMQWQLLANKDAQSSLAGALSSGLTVESVDSLPAAVPFEKGRVVFVSIVRTPRAQTFKEVSDRIDRFLKKNAERFTGKGLTFDNPFQSDVIQAALSLRTFLEIYLSKLEVARDTPGNTETSERQIIELLTTLVTQQRASEVAGLPTDRGLYRLSPTYEKQAAGILTNLIEFRISGSNNALVNDEPGFTAVSTWYNWLQQRCGSLEQDLCRDKGTFDFRTLNTGSSAPRALIVATTKYAEKYAVSNFPKSKVDSNRPIVEQIQAMKANVLKVRELVDTVMRSTNTEPWLLFEKRAVAKLLVGKIQDKMSEPTLKLPESLRANLDKKSEDDFLAFAKEFDAFFSQPAIVLEPEVSSDGTLHRLSLKTNTDHIADTFLQSLRTMAVDPSIANKHNAIKSRYAEIIVSPINELLSPKEAEVLLSRIKIFPELDKTQLTPSNYNDYFKKGILDIRLVGNTPTISINSQGNAIIQKTKALDELFAPEIDTVASGFNAEKILLSQRKARLRELVDSISLTGNFSVNLIGIEYFEKKVADPRLTDMKPLDAGKLAAWRTQALQSLTQSIWDKEGRRFVRGTNDVEVQTLRDRLSVGCNRENQAEIRDCPYPSVGDGGLTAEQSINRLYEIICDTTQSSQKRSDAFKALKEFVDVPSAILEQTAELDKCGLYRDDYPTSKLEWRTGIFRLKPSLTNTPTPSPTP